MSIKQSDRVFGLTFAVVFTVIGSVVWWIRGDYLVWPFASAGVFAALSILSPWILLPLNRLWSWFAGKFVFLNNIVLLGIFYVLLMIPFGLFMRMIGRDPMARKFDTGVKTYWIKPTRQLDRETLRDMF